MKTDNKLYWKTATEPVENIVVRLVLATYADNDNLYVGLEKISGESPECWENLYGHHRQLQCPAIIPCVCGQPGLQQACV